MAESRPGPWTTRYQDRDTDELSVRDTSGRIVCDLRYHATVAEARLIAGAPELLRALRMLADACEADDIRPHVAGCLALARRAIHAASDAQAAP